MTIYNPYTYLIGWSHLNKYYYGVRYAKGCHPSDFWKEYFTSSKNVKLLREVEGEPDIIQIRKTFECPDKAREWEFNIIKRMKLHRDDRFLNACAYPAMSHEAMSKRVPWNKGKTNLYKVSDETKIKISNKHKGILKPGTASSMKENQKTKGWKWYNNTIESIFLNPNETPAEGYVRGRLDTLNGKTLGRQKDDNTKKKFSDAAKNRSLIRICCIICRKELPSNSLGSHNRFCKTTK